MPEESYSISTSGPSIATKSSWEWIEQDKMRAGYLYYYNPVSKINLIKELGLNTIILKSWKFHTANDRQATIKSIRSWAKAAKENNIHVFVAVNWQPYPYMDLLKYKKAVYQDGTEGLAVCPLDDPFWEKHVQDIFMLIANMSKEPNLQIDGILLDMEIYGTEKEPEIKKNYREGRCGFEDTAFSQYLLHKNYKPDALPAVPIKERKQWLTSQKLLDDYFSFLRNQIQNKAANVRIDLEKINPDFLLGMYPHPARDNWVQYPLAKGFSSERLPLIVFGIHSYGYYKDRNGDGYTLIPGDVKERYKEDDINSLYSAGYLLRKYNAKALERNLKQSVKNWDGYWLFNIPQLWKAKDAILKDQELMDIPENVKHAIQNVNLQ